MHALATSLSFVALMFGALLLVPIKRRTVFLVLPIFISTAWAHYFAALAAIGALLGAAVSAPAAVIAGVAAFVLFAGYVRGVTVSQERAFSRGLGPAWHRQLDASTEHDMLQRRWSWRAPRAPRCPCATDVPFAQLPSGPLLCDVWEPPRGVRRSGLAVVYLHGSAWCLLDKDVGTRKFFRHLAARGHVVMDVAYRLCPETDGVGMVHDARRAVVWLKQHAADYGIDPNKVVLMGSSAGAHVALLAAYSEQDGELGPAELRGRDTSVAAVVSYYGVTDLWDYERHARTFLPKGPIPSPAPRPEPSPSAVRMWRRFFGRPIPAANLPPPPAHATLMQDLAGGLPEDVPDRFSLLSPVRHVSRACPPTLLFQAGHDWIATVAAGRALYAALEEARVPAVYIELPLALHAFDLMTPPLFGPAAQAALYDVERFLAWVAAGAKAVKESEVKRHALV